MEEKIRTINILSNEILSDLEKINYFYKDLRKNKQIDKSFEMGIFQGSKSKAFSIAKKLICFGLSVEEVSEITELSTFEIKNFITY